MRNPESLETESPRWSTAASVTRRSGRRWDTFTLISHKTTTRSTKITEKQHKAVTTATRCRRSDCTRTRVWKTFSLHSIQIYEGKLFLLLVSSTSDEVMIPYVSCLFSSLRWLKCSFELVEQAETEAKTESPIGGFGAHIHSDDSAAACLWTERLIKIWFILTSLDLFGRIL